MSVDQNKVLEYKPRHIEKVLRAHIKAIIFDFDDALVDEEHWINERWHKTISFVEDELNIKEFGKYFWDIYYKKGPKYKYHVNDVLERLELDQKLLMIIVNYFLAQKVDEKIFPDALYCLKALFKSYKLGIITDGKEVVQVERIKNAGIYSLFEEIICTKTNPKPSTKCYLECSRKLESDPKNCVYISHDIDTDLRGAKNSGFKTVLIDINDNYEKISSKQRKLIDLHCHSFKEIEQFFISKDAKMN